MSNEAKKCRWCGLPVYGLYAWDSFVCGTGQDFLDRQSQACKEICRLQAIIKEWKDWASMEGTPCDVEAQLKKLIDRDS